MPSIIKDMNSILMITFFYLVPFKKTYTSRYFSTSIKNPSFKLTKEQHETIIGLALGNLSKNISIEMSLNLCTEI
jgi:hypothetical protein